MPEHAVVDTDDLLLTRSKSSMKGCILPTLNLHHYKNHKQPYAAEIVKDGASTKLAFLPKIQTKKSSDGEYGDYQVTINQEGFYVIGNAQEDENGHRLFFKTTSGNKFPFIRGKEAIDDVKIRIARGDSISRIAQDLSL